MDLLHTIWERVNAYQPASVYLNFDKADKVSNLFNNKSVNIPVPLIQKFFKFLTLVPN